ncbi:hypothetical protein BKA67DRAFT_529272 [Truncatella angustata]|uniref:Uncharacterized protein n=1 Tax=Truncatella angustata TaxID=152316 RepID=A0A9P9A129_9PEZI|nr:uncharacterized protein BKA67DRAFT_529272 [Truncatella angustata]KAH6659086.1 hypothetical protein BKA67DRAFT_529272 [Truncatella angustata]KAH8201234.1 hypothetical protein TruAng_004624 [Truncatella angustata]
MMKQYTPVLLAVLSQYLPFGMTQKLAWVTTVVTECFDASTSSKPSVATTVSVQSPQGTYAYSMPLCLECGCPTCTFTSVFTTTLLAFYPTGTTAHPYTVTETYAGMSSLPTFATPTTIPYGFTVTQATCTICDTTPIVMTMTCPSGGVPYATRAFPDTNPLMPAVDRQGLAGGVSYTTRGGNSALPTNDPILPEVSSQGPSTGAPGIGAMPTGDNGQCLQGPTVVLTTFITVLISATPETALTSTLATHSNFERPVFQKSPWNATFTSPPINSMLAMSADSSGSENSLAERFTSNVNAWKSSSTGDTPPPAIRLASGVAEKRVAIETTRVISDGGLSVRPIPQLPLVLLIVVIAALTLPITV